MGNELVIPFPNHMDYDKNENKTEGNNTRIFYKKDKIAEFGKNPEILISIRPNPNSDTSELIYDGNYQF